MRLKIICKMMGLKMVCKYGNVDLKVGYEVDLNVWHWKEFMSVGSRHLDKSF